MSETDEHMPLEIWTDINGNATRTQFKGGVKYIRADERDRLREALKALVSEVGSYTVERQYHSREQASKDLDRRENALLAQLQLAKAALTPGEGGRGMGEVGDDFRDYREKCKEVRRSMVACWRCGFKSMPGEPCYKCEPSKWDEWAKTRPQKQR